MNARKQKIMIVSGIMLLAAGLAWMYIPLALVFLGGVVLIEALTSTGGSVK